MRGLSRLSVFTASGVISSMASVGDAEGGISGITEAAGVTVEETDVAVGAGACRCAEHPGSMRAEIITMRIMSIPIVFIMSPPFLHECH